jgi:hypothetical protein
MVTDDGSFTMLALSSIWDQKFLHFRLPECHPNWANELCLDARKKLSTLDIQRSCLDLRDCLCCDDDDSWVSFYNTFWAKHGVCHPPRGETLDAFTALTGRRIALKWSPSMFFSPSRMFHCYGVMVLIVQATGRC